MSWYEITSTVINILLTGGFLTSLFTLRSLRKKSSADAEKAQQEADATRIDNEKSAMQNFQTFIVDPLKSEIISIRKELAATKREVLKLRKAIEKIGDCEYRETCPIKNELIKESDDEKD